MNALDGRLDDPVREILRSDITADSDGIATSCFDLLDNSLGLLPVKTIRCNRLGRVQ